MTERAIYLSPWRIDLTIRDGIDPIIRVSRLARAMASALDAAGAPAPASIGLILADDAELADLNRVHLGGDGPTDVLSFPLLPTGSFPATSLSGAASPVFATPPGSCLWGGGCGRIGPPALHTTARR